MDRFFVKKSENSPWQGGTSGFWVRNVKSGSEGSFWGSKIALHKGYLQRGLKKSHFSPWRGGTSDFWSEKTKFGLHEGGIRGGHFCGPRTGFLGSSRASARRSRPFLGVHNRRFDPRTGPERPVAVQKSADSCRVLKTFLKTAVKFSKT